MEEQVLEEKTYYVLKGTIAENWYMKEGEGAFGYTSTSKPEKATRYTSVAEAVAGITRIAVKEDRRDHEKGYAERRYNGIGDVTIAKVTETTTVVSTEVTAL